ncbi:restriction endonuclease subunit S [Akkermansiaceae bacterium]|nr:restriction endonuclease subunit S [Akkermansiaceae bacterium]
MTAISQRPQLRFVSYDAEWKVTKIADEIESIDSGWSPQCGNQPATDSEWGILKTTSVVWEGYNEVANKRLSDGLSPRKQIEVQAHDILVTRAGPTDRVGVVVYVNETRPKLMLSDKIIRLRCYERNNSNFVAKYLGSRRAQSYLWGRKSGIATSQTNISQSDLKSVPITLPSLPEQKKIADFLTSVDDRIGQLIKKKALLEDYKKGLMQQLFSQQIRFKDDNGNDFPDWEEKAIGDIASYKNGLAHESNIHESGSYFLISLNSISIEGNLKNDHKRVKVSDGSLQKDDIIMILSDVAHGYFLGLTAIVPEDDKYVLNQRVGRLRITTSVSVEFLRAYLNANQRYFKLHGQGSSQQNLSKGDILKFPISLPSLPEQKKIADFLSAIDQKVESVSQQITKTQTFKKGLLQQMFV